ncbi:schlafen family member 13-like isoform X1 [Stylophora pistillata]|uniref:Schlafen family member 13 n=1 Tax=Stylophora pistillata TaxID=50429 RepID=A0A2B4SNJ2_STYPI|nr:schlafen family member 13-like isoform X1 [Stylophora pistillata]PFX30936.1 Schlafen family member 13 [Stylophora pistillata]
MSKRKAQDSPQKAKLSKPTCSQEQLEHATDYEALFADSGFAGSQDNDPSLTEATRISRGCSTSQEEETMEVVYESDEKQSTSPMCTGETRSHREFCEHHLFCKITLAVSVDTNKKKKKKTKKEDAGAEGCSTNADILKMCNALLNSGGGLLEMELTELQDDGTSEKDSVDSYWRKIEPSLREMIKPSSYDDVFDRCVLSNKIQLFVNAPKQFCTKNYNLYVPSDGSVLPASRDKVAEILMQKPQGSRREANSNVRVALKELLKVPEEFSCNEEFGLTESKQLQYKNYTSGNDLFANHSQREKICKQLSAFGNCDGGVALLGVTDDRRVQGVDLTKNSKDYVVNEIRSLVNKVCPNFEPERGIHWDVAFHPVMEYESHCVVVITMAGIQYSGGVFAKSPESYELRRDEAGKQVPRLLEFHEWKKRVDGARLPENSKGMNELLSKFEKMQISKGALFTIKGGVQRIRDSFFKVDEEFSILPKGAADNLSKEAQEVIHEIQRACCKDWNRGLLVVSRSWLRDTGGKAIDGLICDVLVVSRNMGGLHLYTLCNTVDETSQNYSKEAAQAIKRSLQDNGARGQKFYVSFHVVSCCGRVKVESPLLDGRFPKSYDLESPREKLNEILKAMVIGLTAVPSTLSSKVGETILNLLTEEQFCLVHYMIDKTRELWVKGVAGTGKTLVAVEIIKKIRQRENLGVDEILYVCENEGIANHVRRSRSCTVVCRKTFLDSVFRQARHVIKDEVHNYEQPSGIESWYEKAKRIVRQHDPDRPGYLWFFIDLFQKSHEFPSGIPNEDQQQPQFRLTKIIRNSNKIFRRAKKVLGDVSKVEFDIGHDFEGEEVEEIPYIAKETSQIEVLKKVLQELLDKGYNHGDIAVLFLKKERIPFDEELSVALNGSPWMSAEGNDSDAIVVSTVLKYSGLDRPVLVLVDVKKTLYRRQLRPFLFSAVTRAMVKLIMIYEKKQGCYGRAH